MTQSSCHPPVRGTFGTTRRHALASLLAIPALASPALGQRAFPDRPIRIIVPQGPGTATDVFSRQIGEALPAHLGQPVVIDNRPGGNSIIGTELAARSAPDGYTLLLGTDQALCWNPALLPRLPYDPARDLAPVAGLAALWFVLVTSPTLAARSAEELIALARAQPGRLTFASTGAGTSARITADLFQKDAGIELTHVAYQSGIGPLFTDLMTGRVDMVFYAYQLVKTHLDAGRLRAVATTAIERPAWMPDRPTLHELGYRRTISGATFSLYAPAGTPEDRVARISEAVRSVVNGPELRAVLEPLGTSLTYRGPAELGAFAASERDRCRAIVELTGARLD